MGDRPGGNAIFGGSVGGHFSRQPQSLAGQARKELALLRLRTRIGKPQEGHGPGAGWSHRA